jgi:XTP/dITP diphosphohydrolase
VPKLLLASRNHGKVREFRQLFADLPGLEVIALDALPALPEVVEDGDSFEHNAKKKAREVAAATGMLVVADDSGLEVDALGGAPGVHSARYAGKQGDDAANNAKLIAELTRLHVPEAARTARYHVVLALADPEGPLGSEIHLEHGVCEGRIQLEPRGEGGFGYDPYFVPEGHACTMAELAPEQKNRLSHRAKAAHELAVFLRDYLPRRAR